MRLVLGCHWGSHNIKTRQERIFFPGFNHNSIQLRTVGQGNSCETESFSLKPCLFTLGLMTVGHRVAIIRVHWLGEVTFCCGFFLFGCFGGVGFGGFFPANCPCSLCLQPLIPTSWGVWKSKKNTAAGLPSCFPPRSWPLREGKRPFLLGKSHGYYWDPLILEPTVPPFRLILFALIWITNRQPLQGNTSAGKRQGTSKKCFSEDMIVKALTEVNWNWKVTRSIWRLM